MSGESELPRIRLGGVDDTPEPSTLNLSALLQSESPEQNPEASDSDDSKGDDVPRSVHFAASPPAAPAATSAVSTTSTPCPMLFNDLVPPVRLFLEGSVGPSGSTCKNHAQDVKLIQTLLNAVPSSQGGPTAPLVVDGKPSSKLTEAIKNFQKQKLNFKNPDGKVEPNNLTIKGLVPAVHSQNKIPTTLPGIGEPFPGTTRWLSTLENLNSQTSQFKTTAAPTFSKSEWSLSTTNGCSLSILVMGAVAGEIWVENSSQPGVPYKLVFGGLSLGLSALPAGASYFSSLLPSWGTAIYRGAQAPNPWKPKDFEGPVMLICAEASYSMGVGGTLILFGGDVVTLSNPVLQPLGLYKLKGVGFAAGVQFGTPNAGISVAQGYIAGWH